MDTVLAENTDTVYHRAIKDFAAGRYADALDKYQAIIDQAPNDRIGLLGVAMTFEKLDRQDEAKQAYARYLAIEPNNQSVLAQVIQKATAQPATQARADLEMLLKAGVNTPELLSALSEIAGAAGDTTAAFDYAASAVQQAPAVTMYHLNAGVLADRLNRPAAALAYYEQFLSMFEQRPVIVDTSIDGVRSRVRYLRARL